MPIATFITQKLDGFGLGLRIGDRVVRADEYVVCRYTVRTPEFTIRVHVYICIYIYMYVCVYVCIDMHIFVYTRDTVTYVHTHTYTHTHAHTHTVRKYVGMICMRVYVRMYVWM